MLIRPSNMFILALKTTTAKKGCYRLLYWKHRSIPDSRKEVGRLPFFILNAKCPSVIFIGGTLGATGFGVR